MLDGHSWALAEVPSNIPPMLCDSELIGAVRRPDPPSVVTQHLQTERKFVIINSKVC